MVSVNSNLSNNKPITPKSLKGIIIMKAINYTFMGNCEELTDPFEIETTEYYSIEQARERAKYLLGNYNDKAYVLTSVDIYVGNDYIESAE